MAHIHLLVDRVEVDDSEIRITGSKAALEYAVLDKQIAAGRVPSFKRGWCTAGIRDRWFKSREQATVASIQRPGQRDERTYP